MASFGLVFVRLSGVEWRPGSKADQFAYCTHFNRFLNTHMINAIPLAVLFFCCKSCDCFHKIVFFKKTTHIQRIATYLHIISVLWQDGLHWSSMLTLSILLIKTRFNSNKYFQDKTKLNPFRRPNDTLPVSFLFIYRNVNFISVRSVALACARIHFNEWIQWKNGYF